VWQNPQRDPDTVASEARIYQAEGNLEQTGKLLAGVNAQTPSFLAFGMKMEQLSLERHFDDAVRSIHSRLTEYRDPSDIERLFTQFNLQRDPPGRDRALADPMTIAGRPPRRTPTEIQVVASTAPESVTIGKTR
jgi:hypothetical protein